MFHLFVSDKEHSQETSPPVLCALDFWTVGQVTGVKVPMNMVWLQLSLFLSCSALPQGYCPAHLGSASPLPCPQHPTDLSTHAQAEVSHS